jgi:hypothetical protein
MRYIKQQNLYERTIGDNQLLITPRGILEITPDSGEVLITGNLSVTGSSAGPSNDLIYHVSLEGNDDNSGLSADQGGAKRTIKAAIEAAPPGATIQIAPGDYYEDNPITLKERQTVRGSSLRNTQIWPNNNSQDIFYLDNACYVYQLTFRGLRDPGWCVRIKPGALVTTSPYVQNCSNINGPWLNDGTEFVPFETVQIAGRTPGAKPIINDPDVPLGKRVNETGGGNGMLVDGDEYNQLSLVKSMVADAFTQVAQGGIGFHITNFGYTQIVSCFTVFCRTGFLTTKGGYLSISNSVSDFGTYGIIADDLYDQPYSTCRSTEEYYSGVAAITVNFGGSGYTSAPSVIIGPPDAIDGVQAEATALVDLTTGTVTGIVVTEIGSGYSSAPSISFSGGGGSAVPTVSVILATNASIEVNSLRDLPQVGSILMFEGSSTQHYITGTTVSKQPFRYDETVCRRDVQRILDAVAGDMAFETNYQSLAAGRSYLRSTSSTVILEQLEPTIYAIEALRDEMLSYIPSSIDSQNSITDNFDNIINILERGDSTAAPGVVYNDLVSLPSTTIAAKDNIVLNRDFIVQEVTRYISTQFNDLTYNSSTCLRDIELIINAVYRDIQLGTNHNSITAGLAYRRANASVVDETQLAATILALRQAQSLAEDLVSDNATALSRTTNRFEILLEAIEYGTTPGGGTTFPSPTSASQDLINAARQLRDNRAFLVAETVAYVKATYGSFVFDESLCARDTGYIIDAVTHDLLYNGNIATLIAARAYFYNGATQVPGQTAQTEAAIAHLSSVAEDVIEGILVTKSPLNIEIQVRTPGFGTSTQSAISTSLFSIVEDVIVGGLITTPSNQNPSFGWVDAGIATAAIELITNLSSIQTSVINYITNTIQAFTYNVDTCERDVGYIVDAAVYDMMYGGNKQTRRAAEAYYNNAVIVGEEGFTEFAIKYLASLLRDISQNIIVDFDPTYPIVQQTGPSAGSSTEAAYIKQLVDDIAEVIKLGSATYLPTEVNHNYTSLPVNDKKVDRLAIINNSSDIEDETIRLLNLEYGGIAILEIFPGAVSIQENTLGSLTNVSTVSTSGHAFEYVGAGITYNALPFYGGSAIPENQFVESNGGKVFAGGVVDQIGNFKVGNFFTVNALTGAITLNAEEINLSGLSTIGPLRRDGIVVGVQLREISSNRSLIASTGAPDANTTPTQTAVIGYLEDNYVSKAGNSIITGLLTLEADLTFGTSNIITTEPVFNIANTTTETVNFAGDATLINIGSDTGTTNVNNDLTIYGELTIAGADDSTRGNITTSSETFDLINDNATTVNFAGDATEINIGSLTGTLTISNELVIVDSIKAIQIPVGTTADRPIAVRGQIRYNTTDSTFEGYDGSNWGSLGGVKDVDGNTFIRPETFPGANNNELEFFNDGVRTMLLGNTELTVYPDVFVRSNLRVYNNTLLEGNAIITGSATIGTVDSILDTFTVNADSQFNIYDDTLNAFEILLDGDSIFDISTDSGTALTTFSSLTDVKINSLTTSSDTITGALVIAGGVAIGDNLNVENSVIIGDDLEVNGGDLTTTATTFNLIDTNATTVNFAGAATTVNIGDSSTTTNAGILTLTTDLEVQYGGTGVSEFTENGIVYGDTASPMKVTDAAGTSDTSVSFQLLTVTSDLDATPVWTDTIDGGSF